MLKSRRGIGSLLQSARGGLCAGAHPSLLYTSTIRTPSAALTGQRLNSKLPDAHIFNDAAEEALHEIQEKLEVLEDSNIPNFDIEYAVRVSIASPSVNVTIFLTGWGSDSQTWK